MSAASECEPERTNTLIKPSMSVATITRELRSEIGAKGVFLGVITLASLSAFRLSGLMLGGFRSRSLMLMLLLEGEVILIFAWAGTSSFDISPVPVPLHLSLPLPLAVHSSSSSSLYNADTHSPAIDWSAFGSSDKLDGDGEELILKKDDAFGLKNLFLLLLLLFDREESLNSGGKVLPFAFELSWMLS